MIIKCTSCGTQAKIPDSKEGAKVRCPACKHVFVARPAGARGAKRGEDHTSKFIMAGGIAVGVFVIAIMASRGSSKAAGPAPEVEEEVVKKEVPVYIDPLSWEGAAATFARGLHQASYSANEAKLIASLDLEAAYNYVPIADVAGEVLAPPPKDIVMGGEADEEASEPEAAGAERPAWAALDQTGRLTFQDGLLEAATAGLDDEGPVRDWSPFDGTVVFSEGLVAVVRLRVVCRDANEGLGDRWTQWTLKNPAGLEGPAEQWKWVHVERWVTAEEAAVSRRGRRVKAEKKVLSDGSKVYESKIRAIGFDDDVTPERAAQLTKLVDDLVGDVDARPAIRREITERLEQAGPPAVAPLLTKMASVVEGMSTNNDENLEDRIRLNFIHEVLTDITDNHTTFAVATEMGETQERIESGIKQWYGWYDRKYKKFKSQTDEAVVTDPLLDDPDLKPQTPEEAREYNRALAEEKAKLKENADGN
jgi:predicted Zn finger-like uncharacterized protein